MNKRIVLIVLSVVLAVGALTSCSKGDDKKVNELGGRGELKNAADLYGFINMYDDENIYFLCDVSQTSLLMSYVKLTPDNKVYVNCDIASCNHNDSTCSAIADYIYFRFGDKVYMYGTDDIREADNKKVVYENKIPEDVHDEDADKDISKITILNDEYILVWGNRYGYLVNSDFKIIYAFTDKGKIKRGKIYKDKVYYINDMNELICFDIQTGEKSTVEIGKKLISMDGDGEYIFFTDSDYGVYRYSLETEELVQIIERVIYPDFSVSSGYIYLQNSCSYGRHKAIYDYDGNLVRDCTDCTKMSMDGINMINGKVYSITGSTFNVDEPVCITVMNPDGTDYHEYYLER